MLKRGTAFRCGSSNVRSDFMAVVKSSPDTIDSVRTVIAVGLPNQLMFLAVVLTASSHLFLSQTGGTGIICVCKVFVTDIVSYASPNNTKLEIGSRK